MFVGSWLSLGMIVFTIVLVFILIMASRGDGPDTIRRSASRAAEDEQSLRDLMQLLDRMNTRIENLETILLGDRK